MSLLLQGCVPLTSFTTVTFSGTRLTGLCRSDNQEVATKQRVALKRYLPGLLMQAETDDKEYEEAIDELLAHVNRLGEIFQNSSATTSVFWLGQSALNARITTKILQGAEYVTELYFTEAALNLNYLSRLVKELPQLQKFECFDCNKNNIPDANGQERKLPSPLAANAPNLEVLAITNSNLVGKLPPAWGSWKSLQLLDLSYNDLWGPLPVKWKGMSSLRVLRLIDNNLSGRLPPQYGLPGTKLRTDIEWYIGGDNQWALASPNGIPQSYAYFSTGYMNVAGSTLAKPETCSPGGLTVYVGLPDIFNAPECFQKYSDVTALIALKVLINKTRDSTQLRQTWDTSNAGGAGPNTPPKYCREWIGVACDISYNVVKLDLSMLELSAGDLLSLGSLLQIISRLRELKELNFTGIGIEGSLQDPGVQAGFQKLGNLELLDLSNNAQVISALPTYFRFLTALRKLVVSDTGVTGGLPVEYYSLQALREFRAANCPGINGQLPKEYGLLQSLEVFELTGSTINKQVPADWADPSLLATAKVSALATAKREAAAADAFAKQLQLQLSQPAEVRVQAQSSNLDGRHGPTPSATLKQTVEDLKAAYVNQAATARVVKSLETALATEFAAALGLFKLQKLILANNQLSGPLPAIYSGLQQLQHVDLSSNALTGPLPGSWAQLSELQVLALGGNKLTNKLPISWSTLTKLRVLDLNGNIGLTGPFPYASLRQLAILNIRGTGVDSEMDVWKRFAGTGYQLQCLVLTNGHLSEEEMHELTLLAQGRNPPGDIEFQPTGELCKLESLEDTTNN